MNILEINGIVVVSPTGGSWDDGSISTDETGRDTTATMHNDIIAEKKSLPYSWDGYVTAEDTRNLLQAIKMNGHANVNIKTHNPEENAMQTYNCYVGDRHVPVGVLINDIIYYKGISMTFIEN